MKIANRVPPACASCFRQPLDRRYVDFEVAYDGPVIERGGVKYPVDDLIVCEKCLADAAGLVGLGDVESLTAQRDSAVKASERHAAVAAAAEEKLEIVREAFAALELEMPEPVPASKPKPRARQAKKVEG